MSDRSSDQTNGPIAFAPRLVASDGFHALYNEGMSLIEAVAAYLDGEGRASSRELPREASLLYATESMRLTTRLMQLASWLLLQRAVNEGEISAAHAANEKSKVKFSAEASQRGGPGWADLPETFRTFVEQGDRLFVRVKKLDQLITEGPKFDDQAKPGSVAGQMASLLQAFDRRN